MKRKQISLGSSGFGLSSKRTRKREFLDEMNIVVPWAEPVGLIQPHAPEGKAGQPPFGVETLLRIHFMQQWSTFFGGKISSHPRREARRTLGRRVVDQRAPVITYWFKALYCAAKTAAFAAAMTAGDLQGRSARR